MTDLDELATAAQFDDLLTRLDRWIDADTPWEPLRLCRGLLKQVRDRCERLRARWDLPLVIATFGGTGTGKSTLVNALIGEECTPSGRQRPTTTRPFLIAHNTTPLEPLNLSLEDYEVVRVDSPVVKHAVLIDCPDPDTSEGEAAGSNLARLRQILPICDVLLCVSTQQKYRSARVLEELAEAAPGCRLAFVQTFADLDTDIRHDWRRQLSGRYQVSDIYFIDSLKALREQQSGADPTGDFARLRALFCDRLGQTARQRVRRANLLDLLNSALTLCEGRIAAARPALETVVRVLAEQRESLVKRLAQSLQADLLDSGSLWERRLLGAVADIWGASPFAAILRFYSGMGTWLASMGLYRARTTAQMALIGAAQGVRWLASKQQEMAAEDRLGRVSSLGLDDAWIREAALVISGYARDARLAPELVNRDSFDRLRKQAAVVENEFLVDATVLVDRMIEDLARAHSKPLERWTFEFLFLLLIPYIAGYPAYNFFYAYPVLNRPLLTTDFYMHGAIFLGLWSAALVLAFTMRLRTGLKQRIAALARELAASQLAHGLFPALEDGCVEIDRQTDTLARLSREIAGQLREDEDASQIWSNRTPAA